MSEATTQLERVQILRNLTTAGKVQDVPFDVRLEVIYRWPDFVVPPFGWAVSHQPWRLTAEGIAALGEGA
ncbi:MAG: hypothetical protein ACK5VI_09440 [Opitutia bacterium]